MDAEQLQAAYFKGLDSVPRTGGQMVRHAAGLAEVARQQAEHDAGIADAMSANAEPNWEETNHEAGVRHGADAIAASIRAQFEKEGN